MSTFNLLLLLFIVVDLVVIIVVARKILAKQGNLTTLVDGNLDRLQTYFLATHATIGEYMKANYGGDPSSLPHVLESLMLRLEGEARARGLNLERRVLKQAIAISVARHRAASQRDVERALEHVA